MSEVTPEQVADWAETQFAGLEKSDLRAACKILEIPVPAATSIDGIRNKLLRHYGMVSDVQTVTEIKRKGVRMPPNLRSLSNWQGRRYRVKAQPLEDSGDRPYPVAWEGEVYFMDPKKEYQDIPAPVYHNLRDAESRKLTMRWDANRQENVHTWTKHKRYPLEMMGITPGTENLPEDARGWYIEDAKSHDFYANEDRDSLERIWNVLTDGVRPTRDDKDSRTLDYWRREILQLLGLTPEQLEQAA